MVVHGAGIIPGVKGNTFNKFTVLKKLGAGSFGELFTGINNETHQPVAIKVEKKPTAFPQLHHEYMVYRSVLPTEGFAKCYYNGHNRHMQLIVMDLLG